MIDGPYSPQELQRFREVMPEGAELAYNYTANTYHIRARIEGKQTSEVIEEVPRRNVVEWIRPDPVMNYVARRALRKVGLPAKMKVKG